MPRTAGISVVRPAAGGRVLSRLPRGPPVCSGIDGLARRPDAHLQTSLLGAQLARNGFDHAAVDNPAPVNPMVTASTGGDGFGADQGQDVTTKFAGLRNITTAASDRCPAAVRISADRGLGSWTSGSMTVWDTDGV